MATEIQYRKGTDSQSDAFTGALGEITVDTTTKTLRVHDGATPGGSELVNLNASQILSNKTLNSFVASGTITANSSTGTSGQYLESTGNGVQWSNIDTSSISNGNSDVSVSENSNVTVSVSDAISATFSSEGLVVAGNLTVNGTTTTVNSNEVSVGDSIIDLNADISAGTAPTQDAGITIIRGSEANKSLLWNEATDKWTVGAETFVAGAFEGNISGNVSTPSISKTGTDGVGNIGSSANSFDTVFAKATSAQYADVAEKYVSDDTYPPATVVRIGGEKEITISTSYADPKVAGVITTNPALLMNRDLESEYVADIALTGRVPCQVVGEIKKGDVLTTSDISGVATKLSNKDFVPGCVIGKALENYNSQSPGTIEILVGKV